MAVESLPDKPTRLITLDNALRAREALTSNLDVSPFHRYTLICAYGLSEKARIVTAQTADAIGHELQSFRARLPHTQAAIAVTLDIATTSGVIPSLITRYIRDGVNFSLSATTFPFNSYQPSPEELAAAGEISELYRRMADNPKMKLDFMKAVDKAAASGLKLSDIARVLPRGVEINLSRDVESPRL